MIVNRVRMLLVALFMGVPSSATAQPRIEPAGISGALLLCGGGRVSEAAFDRFIDLAGGAKAKVAVVVVDDEKTGVVVRAGLANSAKKKDAADPEMMGWKAA